MTAAEEQRHSALAEANRIRLAAAVARRRISALPRDEAAREAAAVLREPDEGADSLPIERLLTAIHRIGGRGASVLIADAGLPRARSNRRLRELSDRERCAVADALERWAAQRTMEAVR